MAITKDSGRQEVIAAEVTIKHDTLASDIAVAEGVIQVPEGARVVGGHINVTEVFNSTTSDVLDIGDGGDDDRYTATPIDLTALGATALDVTGYTYTAEDDIDVEWTAGSTGTATTGEATITVLYVVSGRAAFSEG
jgi:hypothetical protein